jgi:hypothetical protein
MQTAIADGRHDNPVGGPRSETLSGATRAFWPPCDTLSRAPVSKTPANPSVSAPTALTCALTPGRRPDSTFVPIINQPEYENGDNGDREGEERVAY